MCDNTPRVLPTGKFTQMLVSRVFTQDHTAQLHLQPSGEWFDTTWPKVLTTDHMVRLSGVSQGLQINKDIVSGRILQRLGDYLPQVKGKGQTFLQAKLNSLLHSKEGRFNSMKLLEITGKVKRFHVYAPPTDHGDMVLPFLAMTWTFLPWALLALVRVIGVALYIPLPT